MIRLTPILILEAFCLYHAYKNNSEQKWYWIILFFPLLGCLFYLYHHFYSKKNIHVVTETIKGTLNTNYTIQKLEQKLNHSDSPQNKINLADEYLKVNRIEEAIDLYESCLESFNYNNQELSKKLVESSYLLGDYESAIFYGDELKDNSDFTNSLQRVSYSWAFYELGQLESAEENFKQMNLAYTNYINRLEYARFLDLTNRNEECIELLEELLEEFNHMNATERKMKKRELNSIQKLYREIQD